MCTASWFYHAQGYSLYFNRDEKLTRSTAQPPATVVTDNGCAIMPIDPDGGGTWLGVNSAGWTFALLNYYQGQIPSGALTSRGVIVKQAANCETIGQIEFLFSSLPLPEFAPFSLVCLAPVHLAAKDKPPEQHESKHSILLFRWTGSSSHRMQTSGLITSSSRYFEQAQRARTKLALQMGIVDEDQNMLGNSPHPTTMISAYRHPGSTAVQNGTDQHRAFHRSHESSCRATSVCMHREDARTVSLSEISVTQDTATYNYFDGAPCEVDTSVSLELSLQQTASSKKNSAIPSQRLSPPNPQATCLGNL